MCKMLHGRLFIFGKKCRHLLLCVSDFRYAEVLLYYGLIDPDEHEGDEAGADGLAPPGVSSARVRAHAATPRMKCTTRNVDVRVTS